ncbi:MAG: hypothetical protein JWO59_1892, partial [Chloroflexi bacterium]|nr:hypothetical protein [Chloroflexota bacterium]
MLATGVVDAGAGIGEARAYTPVTCKESGGQGGMLSHEMVKRVRNRRGHWRHASHIH